MKKVTMVVFSTLVVFFSGCVQKSAEIESASDVTIKAEATAPRHGITKSFAEKLGFLSQVQKSDEKKNILDHGYEFFKKEKK